MMSGRDRVRWTLATLAASLVWGLGMARFTDAAAPIVDAGVAGFSILAQILMARRRIENWIVWIGVDIVAIGLYASRHLYATSGLYALFLLLSVIGLIQWRRAMGRDRAEVFA